MELKKIVTKIALLGVPLTAGHFSHYLLQVADTAMVGRIGPDSLAAIALAGLFTGVLSTFVWPVSTGIQAIASRRFGKEETERSGSFPFTGAAFDNAVVLGAFASTAALLVSFLAPLIARIISPEPNVKRLFIEYISVIRWYLIPMGFFMAASGFLGATRNPGIIMAINIAGNLANIGMNFLFIFGAGPIPAMGIKGAALATVVAMTLQSIAAFIYLFSSRFKKRFHLFEFRSVRLSVLEDMTGNALPPAIQNVIALSVFLTYESMVGTLGAVYIGATHVLFTVFRLNKTIVMGFARASSILVGNALGRKDKKEARHIILGCTVIAAAVGIAVFTAARTIPATLAGVFTNDPETLQLAVTGMRFFAIFFFIEILGYSFEMIFTANGFGKYVLGSELATNLVFIIGFSWVSLTFIGSGIHGPWWGFALYQFSHAAILFAGFLSGKWAERRVEREEAEL